MNLHESLFLFLFIYMYNDSRNSDLQALGLDRLCIDQETCNLIVSRVYTQQ